MKVGVLVPHFGSTVSRERLIGFGPRLEALGYDSAWARDQLSPPPLQFEGASRAFVDPFITLTTIAAQTRSLLLGTAVLIPVRHPLVVSQLLGGLAMLAGPGRLIVGVGAGFARSTFDAVGLDFDRRADLVVELVRALRATWSGPDASYEGTTISFKGVTIDPRPPVSTPIWYGGSSRSGIRQAMLDCDGWLPGRCPFAVFDRLRPSVEDLGERAFTLATIPCVVVDRDRDRALRRVDVPNLLADARRRPAWTPAAAFDTADDLDGAVIAGGAGDCVEGLQRWVDRGVRHLVLDLRFMADDFETAVELLATDVLPRLRAQPTTAARP